MAAEDLILDDDDDDDDYEQYFDDDDQSYTNYELEEDDEIDLIVEEEIAPTTNNTKKKKLTKRQKRKQSRSGDLPLDVRFLHFRTLQDDSEEAIRELEQHFEKLAFDHDLSKFKWISMLEKSLVLKLKQEQEEHEQAAAATPEPPRSKKGRKKKSKPPKTDRVRDYWKVALKAANNKTKVPEQLKQQFLNRMVLGASDQAANDDTIDTDDAQLLTHQDRKDATLLAQGRELAVDNPLLWRRYSAKERKLRVRLSKKLVQTRADEIVATIDSGARDQLDSFQESMLAAVEDRSTSLEYYLKHVRIPALHKLHHHEKTAEQRELEAHVFQQLLKERLPETSYQKMMDLVQTYVDCFGNKNNAASDVDGSRVVTLQGSPFTPIPSAVDEQQKEQTKAQRKQQKQFRVLLSNLRKALPQGRIHWIGHDIADFFYVTAPDEVDPKTEDVITSDPILGHSEATWNETRDQYVQSLWNIQKLFLQLEKEQEQERKLAENANSSSSDLSLSDIDELMDPNEDPSSEKSVLKTFDTVAALSRMDAKKITTQRVKPRTYIPLEAMAVGDTWKKNSELYHLLESQTQPLNGCSTDNPSTFVNGSSSSVYGDDYFPMQPPVDRLVIVDNLPIDMTEFRLREAYSRCGEIENIAVYHSRPDLDPGRRATDASKKIRNPSSSSRRQKWTRPRTPLYAMILYKDASGAQKASCDPLRLFGMVVDQHLMRSHRASDMMTLYLEDVPWSIQTMEYELGKLLEASDLYVCLDDSAQHLNLNTKAGRFGKSKKNPNRSKELLSYTIRFPSFEAAYWSFWKLSRELPLLQTTTTTTTSKLDSPALHWMDTPKDSHLYWTRKLNF